MPSPTDRSPEVNSDDVNTRSHVTDRSDGEARRLYYLDWLRVIAILGVFVVHALQPFGNVGRHIHNSETSRVITLLFFWLWATWGISIFFVISGGGSWIALLRRTPVQYVRSRIARLLVPFVSGTLLFSVLTIWFVSRFEETYDGSLVGFIPTFIETRSYGTFLLTPRVFDNWGIHLWFLGFLFVFSMLSVPIIKWFKTEPGQRFVDWTATIADRRLGLVLFGVAIASVRAAIQPFFPEADSWGDFTYLLGIFILGALLFTDRRFLSAIRRDWLWMGLIGGGSLAVFLVGANAGWHDATGSAGYILVWAAVSLAGWCLSLAVIAVAMRFLDFSNRLLAYSMDVIIPFYVIHYPVVIGASFYVVQWDMSLYLKALIVLVGSFTLTVAIVELFVRRFKWPRILFGMVPLARALEIRDQIS